MILFLLYLDKMATEKEIDYELDQLMIEVFRKHEWYRGSQHFYEQKKNNGFGFSNIASELREKAIMIANEKKDYKLKKEKEAMEDRLDPDGPLTQKDIDCLLTPFNHSTIQRTLEELNVEILKRIVRKRYPHKFA